MDKPPSPWKVPTSVSVKRTRRPLNIDSSSSLSPATCQPPQTKRARLNKFALSRSVSTPTTTNDELQPSTSPQQSENIITRLHHPTISSFHTVNSSNSFSFDEFTKLNEDSFDETTNLKSTSISTFTYPLDWSLKTQCRYFSTQSLQWATKLRSQDETQAIDFIDQISKSDEFLSSLVGDIDSIKSSLLRSLASYWMYPSLCWLKLFPRHSTMATDRNVLEQHSSSLSNNPPLDENIQKQLQDEWKLTFQSLYQLFRLQKCPYFYMCTHHFNCLWFFNKHLQKLQTCISPTTIGFRTTLSKEGIDFTLPYATATNNIINAKRAPLQKFSSVEIDSSSPLKSLNENGFDDSDDENDEMCVKWLQSMGISSDDKNKGKSDQHQTTDILFKKFQSFDSTTLSTTTKHDHRLKSTILIDSENINSLFNFFLNKFQRLCIQYTGQLAGIPPTLISPYPFLNSTLKYLNIYTTSLTHDKQQQYTLEINNGPILPTRMKQICELLNRINQQYQMKCTTSERTSAFNFGELNGDARTIQQLNYDQIQHVYQIIQQQDYKSICS